MNKKNERGETLFHMAASNKDPSILEWIISKCENINATDRYGHTPLHWACRSGHLNNIVILLDNGAAIDPTNKWKETPLMYACKYSPIADIIKLLLTYHANIDLENYDQEKPIDILRNRNVDFKIVKLLHPLYRQI